ncbi:MAG: type III pantothenate kinase [Bdellovibrionales bacterium]|nr:type III pantothenate kinase [Bdellovibrionales bacterium]
MILLLDVGNSQMFGGVIKSETPFNAKGEIKPPDIALRFRKQTQWSTTSDEFGLFLMSVLKENGVDPSEIKKIGICSVVPGVMHSLKGACQDYFNINPFILQVGVKTGLKIKYRNPIEVGADRIANAVAATLMYPNKDLVIVDLGTATTFCAVNNEKEYLGGAIVPGLRISMEALESRTAKLPTVEIVMPEMACGRSTVESIQAGLYYGHLGTMRELIKHYKKDLFAGREPFVVGTGGFSRLFHGTGIFDLEVPDLVLYGIFYAIKLGETV